MPDTPQSPKRKRRWLSFSLRTLLVVVTILCVVLAYWVHRANRQKAVVKWVKENEGAVGYDFELAENGETIKDPKPPGPEWMRAALGNDYFYTVIYVKLDDNELKDVTPLAKLEKLKYLALNNTQVSDLTPITGLKNLKHLYLNNTQVSDLTPLARVTSLTELYLDKTQVRNLTPLAGLLSIKGLWLNNTQVSDLTPLAGLTSLDWLLLNYTPVTQEQFDELQKSLPNCDIGWSPKDKAIQGN